MIRSSTGSQAGMRGLYRPVWPGLATVIAMVALLTGCGGASSSSSHSASSTATATAPAAVASPTAPSGSWRTSRAVGSGVYSTLVYAQCAGGMSCYADGFRQQGSRFPQFLEHWDGKAWTSTDAPGGGLGHPVAPLELDCLSQGYCVVPFEVNQVWIDSVVGGRWTRMPFDDPSTPAFPNAGVNAAACYSETRCVAVGAVGNRAQTDAKPLALVWNGHRWSSTVLAPQGGDRVQSLTSVSCGAASFCIAVGYTARGPSDSGPEHTAIAARWDGSTWRPLAVPVGTRLDDIVCFSPSSCLAVGANGLSGLVLHWNGTGWDEESNSASGPIFAINCSSEDLCMAVQRPSANQPLGTLPVALRWHRHWFKVTGYPAPAAYLSGVSCYDNGCVVVGQARATPSANANDIAGSQATAAFYTIGARSATAATSTTAATPSSVPPAGPAATVVPGRSNVTIVGTLKATLTAQPQECSESGNVHTIQVSGFDGGGAAVTLTVTDQNGGYAQILRGGADYFFEGHGKLSVTPTGASFVGVEMPDNSGFGHGRVTVNGTISC